MKCRVEHIGDARSVHIIIGGYELESGQSSGIVDLSASEVDAIKEWEEEGLARIIPLGSNSDKTVAAKEEPTSRRMTAEEVREFMDRKKRRNKTFTKEEMHAAAQVPRGPSIGNPFAGKGARVFTAADLLSGAHRIPSPTEPVPDQENYVEVKKSTLAASDLKDGVPKTVEPAKVNEDGDPEGFEVDRVEMGSEAKTISADDVKKLRKNHSIPVENKVSKEDQIGEFARQLDGKTKPEVAKIAKALNVSFKQSTSRPDLIAATSERLVEMDFTEIPSE